MKDTLNYFEMEAQSVRKIQALCSTNSCKPSLRKAVFRTHLIAWLNNIRDFVVSAELDWKEPEILLQNGFLVMNFPYHNGLELSLVFYNQLNYRGTLSQFQSSKLVMQYSKAKMSNADINVFFHAYTNGVDKADFSDFFRCELLDRETIQTIAQLPNHLRKSG